MCQPGLRRDFFRVDCWEGVSSNPECGLFASESHPALTRRRSWPVLSISLRCAVAMETPTPMSAPCVWRGSEYTQLLLSHVPERIGSDVAWVAFQCYKKSPFNLILRGENVLPSLFIYLFILFFRMTKMDILIVKEESC